MPESAATSLVGRIRAGDSIQSLVQQAKGIRPPMQQTPEARSDYEEFYHLLQTLPESDADGVLRLAMNGSDVPVVIRFVRDADLLLQLSLKPEHRRIYDFPYKNKCPDALRQGKNPYLQAQLYDPKRSLASSSPSIQPIYDMPYSGATLVEPSLGGLEGGQLDSRPLLRISTSITSQHI